ncbi:MAG: hypothetical protein KDA80_09395 [Planctomycetaceae bacterium]|nr:hypothetical protein [Planctomycetaceae bacterium]
MSAILTRARRSLSNRVRRWVNPLLLNQTCRGIDPRQTLVIAGSNRSGTTWVQETIASIPGAVTVFEPCHVDVIEQARSAGLHKLTYRPADADWPEGEEYFRNVLSGRHWHWYTAFINSPSQCLRPERLVVKFIHANGLIGWLASTFEIPPPLVLVRHPCAVISSVLNLKWDLEGTRQILLQSELVRTSTELTRYIEGLATPLEQLTARWCLENAVLFKMPRPLPAQLVTYESVVLGGSAAMVEILNRWGVEPPASLSEAFAKESRLSAQNRTYKNAQHRLSKWKSERSSEEVRTILRMLNDFGLDFYSEAAVPDEDKFHRCTADGLLNEAVRQRSAA